MDSQHQSQPRKTRLPEEETISLVYHDIFDYPLTPEDLERWIAGEAMKMKAGRPLFQNVGNFFVLPKKEHTIKDRILRIKPSRQKIHSLSGIKHIFEEDNDILMVGITGSLAMLNATKDADVDLMMITKKGRMWQSRLRNLFKLKRKGIAVRRSSDKNEKDKLCLNIWMDEDNLEIEDSRRNPYTAHELAQIMPLVNKQQTYEKLLTANGWIKNFWPYAVEYNKTLKGELSQEAIIKKIVEQISRGGQRAFMSRKITNETVEKGRAFFHPRDFSKIVEAELSKRGVVYK